MTGSRPKVSRSGQPFRYQVVRGRTGDRIRATGGEEYVVNCPQCGDTRGRLYVHHMYGLPSPEQSNPALAGPMTQLCYCQNEQRVVRLTQYLPPYDTWAALMRLETLPSKTDESEDAIFTPPPSRGDCVSLADLPPAHPAREYLRRRGYSPDYLARHHGVGVVQSHPDPKLHALVSGRIAFPFYVDGREVTWQARLAYDLPKGQKYPMKWYFPPGTKKVPWNIDLASQYPVVVLCEGILSALNMGPAGISVGGKSLTYESIKQIRSRWSCAVVAFDPDAGSERRPDDVDYQERAIQELREAGLSEVYGVRWDADIVPRLPDKRDPGSIGVSGCAELLRRSAPSVLSRLPYMVL